MVNKQPPLETRQLTLSPWEEVTGEFLGLEQRDNELFVQLSCGTLVYPCESREAAALLRALKKMDSGQVAILRTDHTAEPLRIRTEA